MIIKHIVSTDLIAKTIALAPTVESTDKVPTINSILNFFGDFKMTVDATLEPIDLLYLLETKHHIRMYDYLDCSFDLTVGDIFYRMPQIFFEKIYSGASYSEILSNDLICSLLAESISNEARRRFANNKYVDKVINDDGIFRGYSLHLIGMEGSDYMIPPITPENDIQLDTQKFFEDDLTSSVINCYKTHDNLRIKGVFSKKVPFSMLVRIIEDADEHNNITIDNISYSIHTMIADGVIPESMYGISKVKNIMGGEHETIDFDINGVNNIIEEKAMVPVVISITNEYSFNGDGSFELDTYSDLNHYLDSVVNDNIASIINEYFPHEEDIEEIDDEYEEEEYEADGWCDSYPLDMYDSDDEEEDPESVDEAFSLLQNEVDELDCKLSKDDMRTLLDPSLRDGINHAIGIAISDSLDDDILENIDKDILEDVIDELNEDDDPISLDETNDQIASSIIIMDDEFAFCAINGSFDVISMLEKNEDYQRDGIKGIIAMDYVDGEPTTYMIGRTYRYDDNDIYRYKWKQINYAEMFDKPNTIAYKVHDWYDGLEKKDNDILLIENGKDTNIGGDYNAKTIC